MTIVADVLVGLVALIHVYIVVLEMFLWTTPRARAAFGKHHVGGVWLFAGVSPGRRPLILG